ncbi:MAG: bifunctional phosphoribosylaminoimidazolecarboxamide formyltransferase/IMP cyclohydrolase [Actinomycetes bacterium]|jgi:phosphoribosylaminoimidazolecarboxamide formyltransferase/IMP cyclohydrolase|nr:bifunctional phosphoribosylaminoimidazolecarboxamide formyltransferase/IMP cyclohydrolase [Actinomycetes bacterium]
MSDNPRIRRALVSVTDKSGVVDFCRSLIDDFGVQVVSTGGTARELTAAGLAVTPIEDVTGFPEMMDGRVKTLHPRVHGGLLARRDLQAHLDAAREHDIEMIDLVVVNLYAFEQTIARADVTEGDAIENIDIGGPSMLRSAAKNFAAVTVVSDPADYGRVLDALRAGDGATTHALRRELAQKVFALTARYDAAIACYLAGTNTEPSERQSDGTSSSDSASVATGLPSLPTLPIAGAEKVQDLRYGENPHQAATFWRLDGAGAHTLARARQLQGKELSYNNILDTDGAWSAVREFTDTACVIVKHTNPCGAAIRSDLVEAYQRAWEGDPVSAYGGIVAFNRPVTAAVIEQVYANKQFVEVMIAPEFQADALELLATRPNLRVLVTGGIEAPGRTHALRSVEGGLLVQDEDAASEDPATFTVAGAVQPTPEQRAEMLFAWKLVKSIKSNAITLTRDLQLVGMGAGQPNRVNSARLAIAQAADKIQGAVAASDAFIPFADTIEVLADAGVRALIQPGGSIRDDEVIAAADRLGVAMLFTHTRHFRH